jgi:hypothetical protein
MAGKALKIDGSGWAEEFRRVSDEGKAIAIMGRGHLVCPFYAAAKWRCAAVNSGEWCRPGQRWTGFKPEILEENTRPVGISQVLL